MPGQFVPSAVLTTRLSIGVARVDELLGGGLRSGESLLVCGPPFSGKRYLLEHAVRAAPQGAAVIAVYAAGPAPDAVAGRARVIDAYSRPAGQRPRTAAIAVNGSRVMEDSVDAVAELLAEEPKRPALVIVDSLSVLKSTASRDEFLMAYRRLVATVRTHEAAGLFALEPEAHAAEDLPLLSRLSGGVLRLAAEYDGNVLSLERADRPRSPWTEYTFGEDRFDVTGSFHATRIR